MANEEKSIGKTLEEKLLSKRKSGLLKLSDKEIAEADAFCEGYMRFLDDSKTEREAVISAIALAEANGFTPFDPKASYNAGDKVYLSNRGKSVIFCVFGTQPLENGTRLLAAHIDISEAISLADRVLVLTKRPARVAFSHELDFGACTDPLKRRESGDFSRWFELLWKELNG